MKHFNPLLFLASLGAGGITIIPFAFFQYVHPHGKGLVTLQEILQTGLVFPVWTYILLGVIMLAFTLIHLVLTVQFSIQFYHYLKTDAAKQLWHDPLKNAAYLAPFISLVMTMNVVIGPVRFFMPWLAVNLQSIMLPAFVFWLGVVIALMIVEIALLKISFTQGFDIDKIHFGWLLHPFALSMATVTGMGFAAIANSADIAHMAAFVSLVIGSMGLFLFAVKIIAIFKRHYAGTGLPEKQFLPSFLIVVPILTLYAISFFRFGHYLSHHHGVDVGAAYYLIVTTALFAFETWYLLFGVTLLASYFRREYRQDEYYPSLWGLICPFVAYAVLASFVFATFVQSNLFILLAVISGTVAILFYADLLTRHIRCRRQAKAIRCI